MKKFNKITIALMLVVAIGAFMLPVMANPISPVIDSLGGSIPTVETAVGKAWNTVKLILQILAVAAVVFAGVRYMFASADQKADIKKSMGILAIGAALVFGATWIIQFIVDITGQVTGQG